MQLLAASVQAAEAVCPWKEGQGPELTAHTRPAGVVHEGRRVGSFLFPRADVRGGVGMCRTQRAKA
jgi:hypothetical protein